MGAQTSLKIAFSLLTSCCIPMMVCAQTVELVNLPSGSSQCEYSAVSGTSTKLTFTCKTSSSTPSAGTLSLVLTGTQSILQGTGSTTFVLRRSGATLGGGSASGDVSLSGGCTLNPSAGTQTYVDNQNGDRTYTVGAGTAVSGNSCVASLTNVLTASTGNNSISISVTTTPPPPPPISGCAAYTGRQIDYPGAETLVSPFGGTTPVAIAFDATKYTQLSSAYQLSITESTTGVPLMQAAISPCPGDFTAGTTYGSACFVYTLPPQYMFVSVGKVNTAQGVCNLPPAEKFYLNIRPTKLDGTTGCRSTTGNCAVYVNLTR